MRWIGCAVLLVPALALLWLPNAPWQMAVVLFLIGAPIGPVLVTIFRVAGEYTPARRLGLVMTLLSAGITLGTSIGNWVGGELADTGGHSAATWVALGAGLSLFASGVVFTAVRSRSAARTPAPPTGELLESVR